MTSTFIIRHIFANALIDKMTQNFHGLMRIDARQTIRQLEIKLIRLVSPSSANRFFRIFQIVFRGISKSA